ncbi:hypothetical protein JQ615_18370 [Bradyrhizobium jicamae]|uniref:Uncharacterized protein n=1 Tax=Bradyrhizobium jicamae TaxID=280332 RepID=A0ABS5FLW1_9BRAD|nr:hypothetical protein [Bradyrhizobium jicamae]MBR0797356.1 hypothetical protein [Bradyrhizobium jicamae]
MKPSVELEGDLGRTIGEILQLEAEWDRNRAAPSTHRLSASEDREEREKARRREAVTSEIRRLEGVAAGLRRDIANTRTTELAPVVQVVPSKGAAQMARVRENIESAQAEIENLHARQRELIVAAAAGDKAAARKLEELKIAAARAGNQIETGIEATELLQQQRAEELLEFSIRDADAKFTAGRNAAAAAVVAHDRATDEMMRALAGHLAERPALLNAVRKSGCEIDDARLNSLWTVEVLHRAAKASGLAGHLRIAIKDAVPLAQASDTLLRHTVRRPNLKDKAA